MEIHGHFCWCICGTNVGYYHSPLSHVDSISWYVSSHRHQCVFDTDDTGLGLLFLVETSQSLPFDAVTVTVPYFATTISLDVLLTMLIVARLLRFCSRLVRALGEEHGKYYRYLSMVLMESASLFAMFSSMLLITEAVNSSLAYLFLQVVGQIQASACVSSS